LFSGAGGLDLGLETSGWRVLYATDLERDAVETLQRNQGRPIRGGHFAEYATISRQDVRSLAADDILATAGARKGQIPLLAGGPPCQSWSSAGFQQGFDDPRGVLFRDFVRLADECGCRLVLFENVRGLLTARGPDGDPGGALRVIRTTLWERGFYSTLALLNAADFGVPQRRVRLFIIGFRDCGYPQFPSPTHHRPAADELGLGKSWNPLLSVLLAERDLRGDEWVLPSPKMAARLKGVLPGQGVKSPGKRETTRPGGHWGYMQGGFVADPSLPSRTITASSQQDWVLLGRGTYRRLCPRECAAIQSFPGDWEFAGNRASQYRQIGNAVAPAVAAALGLALRRALAAPPHSDRHFDPAFLPRPLQDAVEYTRREERRNGDSRRNAPVKRRPATSTRSK
jgi:DNA (cytosine-5)-methyltransferase 1